MSERTEKLKVNGLEIDLPYIKRDFGSAEVATSYGDVPVSIDGKTYTLRIGEREWWAAQEKFRVKGVQNIIREADKDERSLADFYLIALSRHHAEEIKKKDLTIDRVGDLMDWKDEASGRKPLRDAMDRCIAFSRPALFPDEVLDPKGLTAALELIAAKTNQQEAKSS